MELADDERCEDEDQGEFAISSCSLRFTESKLAFFLNCRHIDGGSGQEDRFLEYSLLCQEIGSDSQGLWRIYLDEFEVYRCGKFGIELATTLHTTASDSNHHRFFCFDVSWTDLWRSLYTRCHRSWLEHELSHKSSSNWWDRLKAIVLQTSNDWKGAIACSRSQLDFHPKIRHREGTSWQVLASSCDLFSNDWQGV